MNKKLKSEWIKALRSKKYRQGTLMLHDEDAGNYCCLGVLCVVAKKETDANAYEWLKQVTRDFGPFVSMNDDEGKSFSEIADYIEKNL